MTMNAQQLQALLAKRRSLLEQAQDDATGRYAAQARKLEARILRLVENADERATPAARAKIMAAINGAIEAGGTIDAEADMLRILSASIKAQSEYVEGAYRSVPKRIAQTFTNLDERIRNRQILGNPALTETRELWAAKWNGHWDELGAELRARMTRAQLTGDTIRSVSRGLVDDLGRLNIEGRKDPDAWARDFVRTTQQQLYSDFSIATAAAAGIEKFVNIGVSDERQSQECYEASQQPPMTMEEWDEWRASNGKGGRPGYRHVMNCRCVPGPVPPGLEDDDWTQPNPKFEEEEAAT